MENLLSSILNIHIDIDVCNTYSLWELINNDKFKSLSEIGFRFKSRPIFDIINNISSKCI